MLRHCLSGSENDGRMPYFKITIQQQLEVSCSYNGI
jgi:hypothetical protein